MILSLDSTRNDEGPTWVEYIPQLDAIATSRLAIVDGHAVAPDTPGLGIEWRWDEVERRARATHTIT